jgi:hypothetical protein
MKKHDLMEWLLKGDVSIQYQAHRDLLDSEQSLLRDRISQEGWGAAFLFHRKNSGHWGRGFYQPKWTSTHYTMLDLRNLGIVSTIKEIEQTMAMILKNEKGEDGGINPSKTIENSDVCINGMVLNYASYFGVNEKDLSSIVDFILTQHMKDGGFNCLSNRKGAVHSSLHTTLSVIEGISEYARTGYSYRLKKLQSVELASREFILRHKLFKSDRTGKIIDNRFLMLSYPSRWRYDILRALDYFRQAGVAYDVRMEDAFDVLLKKRKPDTRWPLQARHAGQTHFEMETPGEASRWNTLRALRVLRYFRING